jgi:putative heme transporter
MAAPARAGARVKGFLRRHGLRWIPLVLVVAVFAAVLPRIADYGAVLDQIGDMDTTAVVALAVAAIVNIATFPPPLMAALPGLSYMRSLAVTMSATAISNTVPGGDAVGLAAIYGYLRSWRFESVASTLALLLTGLWNQFVNIAFPIAAVILLAVSGESNDLLGRAALIGGLVLLAVLVLLVMLLRSEGAAYRIGGVVDRIGSAILRPLRRGPVAGTGARIALVRDQSLELVMRRWHVLSIATIAGHLTVWLVLLVALRAVDVGAGQVSWQESFAAWSFVRLLTAVPLTPGGLGVVELGLTGALVGFGGTEANVVAAVLIYRALTFLPPIPIGALCMILFRPTRAPDPAREVSP